MIRPRPLKVPPEATLPTLVRRLPGHRDDLGKPIAHARGVETEDETQDENDETRDVHATHSTGPAPLPAPWLRPNIQRTSGVYSQMLDSEHPVLRWLHLTDLHAGHGNESQTTALRSLIASILNVAGETPFDAVLLTGDLAYSGRPAEYAVLKSQLIDPLRQTSLFANAQFVATPGNHDLDCAIEYPPIWKSLGRNRQERFFHLGTDGKRTRGTRTQAFAAYQDFVTTNRILSANPTAKPASIHTIDGKTKPIILVSAVTAFFSDKEVEDKRLSPAPVHPIRTLLESRPEGSIVIVLGHHPPDWFTQETEPHLRTLLLNHNALYFHGHEHRIMPRFGPHGLISLGFGAAYVAPNDSLPTPYYRNSYAICELTDSLHVSFVSWEAEQGQWRSDPRTPGDFDERSNRFRDGYCVRLPTTRIAGTRRFSAIASAYHPRLRIEQCLWLVTDDTKRWLELLSTLDLLRGMTDPYALVYRTLPAGHTQFRAKNQPNSVVVLGDPGSGKTCFLQHEILAYCAPPSDGGSWYSQHLPIYVTLAEAARLLDENTSLLDVAAIVSSRRGIQLPRSVIDNAISDGRAAFFFDGLDEVGYIDKRIALISEIDALMGSSASRGNRFILASRPAAIQPVDIPDAFTFLHLRGLTETEIRLLAENVLTARLGLGEDHNPSDEEAELVDRLVADTRNKPGIARIARNPLLLTLLVLIYANTGALSARRHLIYTQAVKTLVSVRGRETREQQISEADLRTRLGTLALAIFQKDIAEIPGRQEVVSLLAPVVAAREDRSPTEVADSFIQEVAESTGLLAIHSKEEEKSDALITFMHYSFLEYYAAAGLLAREHVSSVSELSANPRWRDVTTLLFGMLSEQGDITPLLKGLLSSESASESISKYKTVLALDCANECDVPPEESQELLATAVHATISSGAGRYCPDLRQKMSERLEPLLQGTSRSMERALARGLRSDDPISSAAFGDLIARIGDGITLPPALIAAFEEYLNNSDSVARATAMHAIERRPELRTEKSMDVLMKALRGNLVEKHAALKVVAVMPLDESLRERTRELLDDPNALISAAAAQCLLVDTLRLHGSTPTEPLLEKVLSKLHQDSSENTGVVLQSVTLDRSVIYDLVFGDDPNESELAIRHVPLMKDDDPHFAYNVLMQHLRTAGSPTHEAACLDSLRESPRAINLITIADTDLICEQLQARVETCELRRSG